MPEDLTPKTLCDGQIEHVFAAGSYVVPADPGDFNWDVPDAPIDLFLQRGKITETPLVRRGEEAPMTFGYSAYLMDIGALAGDYATLADTVWRYDGNFAASNFTSVMSGTDAVLCDTNYTISGTATGTADKTLGFPKSSLRASGAEGRPNTINVTGTAFALKPVLS